MSILIATKGPKNGQCNICGEIGPLTDDHTPPKGCMKPTQQNMLHISERLSNKKELPKGRISQNGVKYRTLCERCNSGKLGTQYDPEFIKYVNAVGDILKSDFVTSNVCTVKTKPQRVMRSLLGHISAQGVNRYEKGALTVPIRDYFLDTNLPLPPQLRIYTWVYPYRGYVMARDCGLVDFKVHEPVVIWFLKFFPVAFLITFNEPKEYTFDFIELSKWRSDPIDTEVDLDVVLQPLVHEYWPEAPSDTSAVMYGDGAVTSYPWEKRKR